MKKFFFLLIALFIFTSCEKSIKGEGDAGLAQDFKLEPFDAVDAAGKFKLVLIPNDSAYVSVQTHKNLIENMDIYVQGKTLHIGEKESIDSFEGYVVYLYYNAELDKITLQEKVYMESSNQLTFDEFEIKAKDESIIKQFAINAKEMDLEVTDKAEIDMSGEVSTMDLKAKDYAKIALEKVNVKVLDVDMDGESEAMVHATKELNGRVLENSTLQFIGNPQKDVDVKDNGEILNQ